MTKTKLIAKVGKVTFLCGTVEEAIARVNSESAKWYAAGLCELSDASDWNIWSNRRTATGGRRHVANIQNGSVQ